MRILDDQVIEMRKEGTTDLRKMFPVSQRRIAKRVVPWVLLAIALNWAVISFVSSLDGSVGGSFLETTQSIALILLFVSIVACIGKFAYEELYQTRYRYAIEAGHLVICKGLFLKERGSFPLSRITEVYLDRSWLDLIFGIYVLHVSTPTNHSDEFARIVGLTQKNAMGLQEIITSSVDSPIDMEMAEVGAKTSRGLPKRKFSKEAIKKAEKTRPIMGS